MENPPKLKQKMYRWALGILTLQEKIFIYSSLQIIIITSDYPVEKDYMYLSVKTAFLVFVEWSLGTVFINTQLENEMKFFDSRALGILLSMFSCIPLWPAL